VTESGWEPIPPAATDADRAALEADGWHILNAQWRWADGRGPRP
jgi:hypothetical protein